MSETKFVLGPKQREWIKSLRGIPPLRKYDMVIPSDARVIGLKTWTGSFIKNTAGELWSLYDMRDFGMTWPEIADYVEANPENVFTKSV